MERYPHTLSHLRALGPLALFAVLFGMTMPTTAQQQTPPPSLERNQIPPVVAKVNGDEIRRSELFAQAQMMRYQAVRSGQQDPGNQPGFYYLVLDALIGEHLVYLEMKKAGNLVSPERIDREVASMAASYDSEAAFDEALTRQEITRESLRYQLEKNLSIEKLLEEEIGPSIAIADTAKREYYENYKDQMKVPESRRVRHLLMRIPVMGGDEAREEVKTRLLGLRQQALDGADFEALVRDYSEDAATRERGGMLPWIAISGKANIFEQTAGDLEKLGDVSDVIETELGYHILQLVDREPARLRTYEEVQGNIEGVLRTVQVRQEVQRRLEGLRQKAKVEILI